MVLILSEREVWALLPFYEYCLYAYLQDVHNNSSTIFCMYRHISLRAKCSQPSMKRNTNISEITNLATGNSHWNCRVFNRWKCPSPHTPKTLVPLDAVRRWRYLKQEACDKGKWNKMWFCRRWFADVSWGFLFGDRFGILWVSSQGQVQTVEIGFLRLRDMWKFSALHWSVPTCVHSLLTQLKASKPSTVFPKAWCDLFGSMSSQSLCKKWL